MTKSKIYVIIHIENLKKEVKNMFDLFTEMQNDFFNFCKQADDFIEKQKNESEVHNENEKD